MKLTPLSRPTGVALRAAVVALALSATAGCRDIEGGSIEASWIINTAGGGKRIDCACARFGAVRYRIIDVATGAQPCLESGGDGGGPTDATAAVDTTAGDGDAGAAGARCEFDCVAGVGTTAFFIPPGDYAISIQPLDLEGKALGPADGIAVPAPTNRTVRRGEVTNLGVHLIAAEEARLAGPSSCDPDVLTP
ncbi:MAG: hypothetical protein KC503_06555 [Myxococcales bacterium]|nr:hypothetical protein [Myxococcales bacterium]